MPIIDKIQLSGTVYTIGSENSGVTSGEVQTMIDNSLSGYVYTADNGKQDIYGSKTFIGNKRISFTQGGSNDKLGFTLYDTRDEQGKAKEFGAFELNPTGITENSVTHPLLTLNHYRSNNGRDAQTYIGYRQYDYPHSAAYHLLAPLPENAKTPFGLTTNFQNFYMPLGIKVDNSTMVKADSGGVMDISSYIGGGGKAVSGGTNISITTGETADTINCTLPISAGTGTNSLIVGFNTSDSYWKPTASGKNSIAHGAKCTAVRECSIATGYLNTADANYSIAQGYHTSAYGGSSHSEGWDSVTRASYSHAEGNNCITSGESSHAEGIFTNTSNKGEHSEGWYNVTRKNSTTFGDSGNTLFSVGNGTANNARHNAFEIRQNGDIYCSDGTNDVKLQDTITATAANTAALGGLSLVKLTQAQYDALATKDSNVLYVIVG